MPYKDVATPIKYRCELTRLRVLYKAFMHEANEVIPVLTLYCKIPLGNLFPDIDNIVTLQQLHEILNKDGDLEVYTEKERMEITYLVVNLTLFKHNYLMLTDMPEDSTMIVSELLKPYKVIVDNLRKPM